MNVGLNVLQRWHELQCALLLRSKAAKGGVVKSSMKFALILPVMIFPLVLAEARPSAIEGDTPGAGVADCQVKAASAKMPNFKSMQGAERKKAFIEWMKPYALQIQAETGFPASVMIAKSGYESGWGSSGNARKGNLFGIACEHKTYRYKPGAKYEEAKTDGCSGSYSTFKDGRSSIVAFADKIMWEQQFASLYTEIRGAARASVQSGTVDSGKILPLVGVWCTGSKKKSVKCKDGNTYDGYVKQMTGILRSNKLDRFDACGSGAKLKIEFAGGLGAGRGSGGTAVASAAGGTP